MTWRRWFAVRLTSTRRKLARKPRPIGGFLGRAGVLRQSRYAYPATSEERFTRRPTIACRSKWVRIERLRRDRAWLELYEAAKERVRAGETNVRFPYWTLESPGLLRRCLRAATRTRPRLPRRLIAEKPLAAAPAGLVCATPSSSGKPVRPPRHSLIPYPGLPSASSTKQPSVGASVTKQPSVGASVGASSVGASFMQDDLRSGVPSGVPSRKTLGQGFRARSFRSQSGASLLPGYSAVRGQVRSSISLHLSRTSPLCAKSNSMRKVSSGSCVKVTSQVSGYPPVPTPKAKFTINSCAHRQTSKRSGSDSPGS